MHKREVLFALPFSRETTTTITVLHDAIVALFAIEEFDSRIRTSDSLTHNHWDNPPESVHCTVGRTYHTKRWSSEAIFTRGSICCVNGRGHEEQEEEGEVVVAFNTDGEEGEHSTLPLYLGMCRFYLEGNAYVLEWLQLNGINLR